VSGEFRVVGTALRWGTLALLPVALIAGGARGYRGALSASLALGLVLANVLISAALSAGAGKIAPFGAAMIAFPSFIVRMSGIGAALVMLDGKSYIDEHVFVFAFAAAITAVLILEARSMRRTPWLALTFGPKEQS
jgi:hypothetical protein